MNRCDSCGNTYDKSFNVVMDEKTYTFDSFECAIHKLAPSCEHCGCRILGHGTESSGDIFCCAHCAKQKGFEGAVDRDPADAGAQPSSG